MGRSRKPENIEEEELMTGDVSLDSCEETERLRAEIAELREELDTVAAAAEKEAQSAKDLQGVMLRLQADFDNYRKRTADQIKKTKEDGAVEVLAKFIPALDVITQAMAMIADEKVADGVRMIYNQLNDVLLGFGVEEIAALGKPFDPNLHNAMMQVNVNNPDQIGLVVEVFQKGYRMNERILRHSVVKVGC